MWGSMGIAFSFNVAWCAQSEYMFAVLRVGYLQSIREANQINNIYIFTSTLLGPIIGIGIYRIRYLRPFILAGTLIFLAGFVLLAIVNSGVTEPTAATATKIDPPTRFVIGGQVLLGIGGSLFPFLTMASVQAAVRHEHLAAVTGLYFATYRVGAAVGGCVAAVVMNQYGRPYFYEVLSRSDYVAGYAYEAPLQFADEMFCPNAPGAEYECPLLQSDKVATARAYQHIQFILCVIAAAMCIPLIIFAFTIRNPKLGDDKTEYAVEVLRPHEPYPPDQATSSKPDQSLRNSARNGSPNRPRTPIMSSISALARSMTPHSRRSNSISQSRRGSLLGPLNFTPSRKSGKSSNLEMDNMGIVPPVPGRLDNSGIWDGTQGTANEGVQTTICAGPKREEV